MKLNTRTALDAYGVYKGFKDLRGIIQARNNAAPIAELNSFFDQYKELDVIKKFGIKKAPFSGDSEQGFTLSDGVFDDSQCKVNDISSKVSPNMNSTGLDQFLFLNVVQDEIKSSINKYIVVKEGGRFDKTNYEVPFLKYIQYILDVTVSSFEGKDPDEIKVLYFIKLYLKKFALLNQEATRRNELLKPAIDCIDKAIVRLNAMVDNFSYEAGFFDATRNLALESKALYELGVKLAVREPGTEQVHWLSVSNNDLDNPYYQRANDFSLKEVSKTRGEIVTNEAFFQKGAKRKRAERFIGINFSESLSKLQACDFVTNGGRKLSKENKILQAMEIDYIFDLQEFTFDAALLLNSLAKVFAMSPQLMITNKRNVQQITKFLQAVIDKKTKLYSREGFVFLRRNLSAMEHNSKIIKKNIFGKALSFLEEVKKNSNNSIFKLNSKLSSGELCSNLSMAMTKEMENLNELSSVFCMKYNMSVFPFLGVGNGPKKSDLNTNFNKNKVISTENTIEQNKNILLQNKNIELEKCERELSQKMGNIREKTNQILGMYGSSKNDNAGSNKVFNKKSEIDLNKKDLSTIVEKVPNHNFVHINKNNMAMNGNQMASEVLSNLDTLKKRLLEKEKFNKKINKMYQDNLETSQKKLAATQEELESVKVSMVKADNVVKEYYELQTSELNLILEDLLTLQKNSELIVSKLQKSTECSEVDTTTNMRKQIISLQNNSKKLSLTVQCLFTRIERIKANLGIFMKNFASESDQIYSKLNNADQQLEKIKGQQDMIDKKIKEVTFESLCIENEKLEQRRENKNKNISFIRRFLSKQAKQVRFGGSYIDAESANKLLTSSETRLPRNIAEIMTNNAGKISESFEMSPEDFQQVLLDLVREQTKKSLNEKSFFRTSEMQSRYERWNSVSSTISSLNC